MSEVYVVSGVAHEVVNASRRESSSAFMWIDVRCGAQLPPQLGPANVHEDAPVTCLLCLGWVEPEVDPPEDNDDDSYPPYGYGSIGEDEDGSVYHDDDD